MFGLLPLARRLADDAGAGARIAASATLNP
jgi:hypothetical protein